MVREIKGKSEIAAIPNKYKDILDDLINNSNIESPDYLNFLNYLGLIDKGSCNASKFRDSSPTFLEEDCLDNNISITLLELAPKI